LRFPRPPSRSGSSRGSSPRSGLPAGTSGSSRMSSSASKKTHGFRGRAPASRRGVLVVDDQSEGGRGRWFAWLRAYDPRAGANGFEGLLKGRHLPSRRPGCSTSACRVWTGSRSARQIKRDPLIRDTRVVIMTARLARRGSRARDGGGRRRDPAQAPRDRRGPPAPDPSASARAALRRAPPAAARPALNCGSARPRVIIPAMSDLEHELRRPRRRRRALRPLLPPALLDGRLDVPDGADGRRDPASRRRRGRPAIEGREQARRRRSLPRGGGYLR